MRANESIKTNNKYTLMNCYISHVAVSRIEYE